jgi:5-methylcytosine-specific restriction protein B
MADGKTRYALIIWEILHILRDAAEPKQASEMVALVSDLIQPTPHEKERLKSGGSRWETVLGFVSGDAVTVGWMSKLGGWTITEVGIEACETYSTPEELYSELYRRWREIDQRRKQAQKNLSDVQQFITTTLRLVEPGFWTAHEDLAELAGTTANEVADFLASGKVNIPTSYRVLHADGSIPVEGMLNSAYRGVDLHRRLASEGIEFNEDGHATRAQRLTSDALKELLDARAAEDGQPAPVKRAWMVRGTSVDGFNLVPEWLREGFVSLSASQLSSLDPSVGYDELKQAVETAYQHKSYAYRGQRLEELDRFMRRMHEGDLVLTPMGGGVYLGEVTGPARFMGSAAPHSNLRRPVRWLNATDPIDGAELHAPVPALLQSQAYVVDLTEAYDELAALVLDHVAEDLNQIKADLRTTMTVPARRELTFNPVTPEVAAELLMDQAELARIADLLWERKQVIFYGPPGTGKTYLASKLARQLTEDGAVKLVQFHPSYTYEDFFEGFRPEPGGSGTLTFKLRAGPFRDFAEVAAANPSTAYILIIDEINRANLAKVFGELYFLLEYRDQSISLQYSPDKEFILPDNLFLIGTMNTADRSIARIDTAMRRRFVFVELDPRVPPVRGLLARWLTEHHLPPETACLLDELNKRLDDSDAAIGPSYLMKQEIYRRADGLDRVWQYDIMPLLEDLFYGQRDLAEQFGLTGLRKAIAPAPPPAEP